MTAQELYQETVDIRATGREPNFAQNHKCPKCGLEYLCPDRYKLPHCTPSHNYPESDLTFYTCMPCMLPSMSEDEKTTWIKAHAI